MIDFEKLTWDMVPGSMLININYLEKCIMKISVYDVIESAGRNNIIKHIEECDNSPWLKRWQTEKQQAYEKEGDRIVGLIKGK